jgi:L-alanine-DL-glutamate epimerase-like enolase superfamily enzyme
MLKIAAVEPFRLYPVAIKEAWADDEYVWPSHPPSFLVKVTAENGDYGVGEISSQQWYLGETPDQIAELVAIYDGALRGQNATNIAFCQFKMEEAFGGGMPGARGARSGVDMALHDLVAKHRDIPVYELIGGGLRTKFEMLTNLYHKTPDEMAEGCREYVGRGFKGLKIKVGDEMLSKGWTRANFLSELDKLQAAIEATPRDVYIDADANQGWLSANWTVSALRQFEGCNNLSIEQPLGHADLTGHAHVRARAGVPVILDESVWSPEAVLQIARHQAGDRIVLKLNRLGGFSEAVKAIHICDAAAIGVSVDTNPYTLVGDTACCHVATVPKVAYPVDCEGHVSFLDWGEEKFITGGITIRDGKAYLPDGPGLGVDIDWAALKRHQDMGYDR